VEIFGPWGSAGAGCLLGGAATRGAGSRSQELGRETHPRSFLGRRGGGRFHTSVDFHTCVEYPILVNAQELKKLLAEKGCKFETRRSGSGDLTVTLKGRKSQLPMHGSRKELGKGLVNKILKDLGLK
jgi:mRNA interferase HicA